MRLAVRRPLVFAGAVCLALIATACGGSGKHAPAQASGTAASTAARTTTSDAVTVAVQTRTTAPPPTPAQIEQAATLTAAEPGFTAQLRASISLPQLSGNAVSAIGNGHFDPRSDSGTLDLAVGLPGLLSLAGPLPVEVRLVGGEAYVQVPPDVATEIGTSYAWLQESIAALGLGDSLSAPDILREVARDATQTIAGQRAAVTLDANTGLLHTIVLSFAVAGGYHVHVRLTLTGFGTQSATAAPPPAQTGELQTELRALGV